MPINNSMQQEMPLEIIKTNIKTNSHLVCSNGKFGIEKLAAYFSTSKGNCHTVGNLTILLKSSIGWHKTNHYRQAYERRGWTGTISILPGHPQQPNSGFGIVKEKQGCLPSVKAFPPKCNTQLVYGKGRRNVDLFFCTNHQ